MSKPVVSFGLIMGRPHLASILKVQVWPSSRLTLTVKFSFELPKATVLGTPHLVELKGHMLFANVGLVKVFEQKKLLFVA